MNKRKFTYKDYNMTPARRRELIAFCEQYQEWKDELLYNKDTVHSTGFNGMPFSRTNNKSDPTAELAMRHTALQQKIDLIENTASNTDGKINKRSGSQIHPGRKANGNCQFFIGDRSCQQE